MWLGYDAHAHCSMHDIPCHALIAHYLLIGGVEARVCDSSALENMYCSLKYEILNQLTYITTSLKRSYSANRTIAGNSYADA